VKPIRLLLADDHKLMRAGIRSLIKELAEFEVVGEADHGREAIRLVEELKPDVVLMDVLMPEMNGLDATARIVSAFPSVYVIILSMTACEENVLQAVQAGASGYLLKNIGPNELEQAIRAVHNGGKHFPGEVGKHLVTGLIEGKKSSLERLTPRQREVLQLVAEGYASKEIAKKLNLSVKTIEVHRSELMKALDIHQIAGLVRYAIRIGLVSTDS
jgi:DNA-binding NarL/FixJ family response regulator